MATIKGGKNKAGLTLKNNIITLKNSALENKVTVSGSGYEFNFASDYNQATISGSNGADIITSRGKKLSINGGKGNDSIKILGSAMTVTGGAGNDTITSNGKNNLFVFTSGAGDDEFQGYSGNDSLWGGGGKDTFIYKPGEGIDEFLDYDNDEGDMLKIFKADGSEGGSFTNSSFKNGSLILAISSGGKININDTSYTIKGKKLVVSG